MRTLNIKYTYCVTLYNINKLDGYVRPPQIIVLLLQQKDVQLCNDYKSFSQVIITDTTPFVLVNRRKSLGLEISLTFLYIDTRMFLPFNCQYNPNIGFLIICFSSNNVIHDVLNKRLI